jgi:DNA-binding MarR family transcriptional regulator
MSIFDPVYRQKNIGGQITRTLFHIGQAVKNLFWDKGRLEHLTPAQAKSLLFINYTRKDAITIGNIARYLTCTPATASGVIDSLERKKLIIRSRDPEDRRRVHITLTPEGERVVGDIENIGYEIEEIVSDFGPEEQKILEQLLHKISVKLMERGLIFSGDICTDCCFFKRNSHLGERKPHYCENLHILLSEEEICKECPHFKRTLN